MMEGTGDRDDPRKDAMLGKRVPGSLAGRSRKARRKTTLDISARHRSIQDSFPSMWMYGLQIKPVQS
jgi:hypothetical protein